MMRRFAQTAKIYWGVVLTNVLLTLVYAVIAKWSLGFAIINKSISPIWPPTGLALAAVLIYGPAVLPAVFFGAFLTNFTTTGSYLSSLAIAFGNTLEAASAEMLILLFADGLQFIKSQKNVLRFAIFAGLVGPVVAATIGTVALIFTGLVDPHVISISWLTWVLGDMSGAIIVTPLLIYWYMDHKFRTYFRNTAKLFLLTVVLLLTSYLVFTGIFPYPYIIMPVLLWIAFAYGPKETVTGIFVVAIIASYATLNRTGPFYMGPMHENTSLLYLQVFLITLSVSKLIVAATVSQDRQKGQEIRDKERWFRTIIEKSTDGVALLDTKATILYASPSTKQILGYTSQELVGTSGLSLVHPEDIERVSKILSRVIATPNTPIITEFRFKQKNGSWAWIETTGRNLITDPVIHAIVINYRDISERMNLEYAKDEFMMIAAHQLRSPISVIRWNSELIMQDTAPITPTTRHRLLSITDSTKKINAVVSELLEVSRLISGNITFHRTEFNIHTVIRDEIKSLAPMSTRQKIRIQVHEDRNIPHVFIDKDRFTTIIQNVLTNAVKYSNPSTEIHVRTQRAPTDIIISVTDEGIGIPTEELRSIFTKFVRGSNAKKRDPNGTGLGLYAAKNYLTHWGGSIQIQSPVKDGHGTIVTIHLPLKLTVLTGKEHI